MSGRDATRDAKGKCYGCGSPIEAEHRSDCRWYPLGGYRRGMRVEVAPDQRRVEMQEARVILEVTAGILPGTPEPVLTQRYVITSEEWQGDNPAVDHGRLLAERNAAAQGYAAWLMMQPERVNWVRLDWLWL